MKVPTKTMMFELSAYLKQKHRPSNYENHTAKKAALKTELLHMLKMNQTNHVLEEILDMRKKTVREVKEALNDGTYKVEGGRVACAMLREAFENDMILADLDNRILAAYE